MILLLSKGQVLWRYKGLMMLQEEVDFFCSRRRGPPLALVAPTELSVFLLDTHVYRGLIIIIKVICFK